MQPPLSDYMRLSSKKFNDISSLTFSCILGFCLGISLCSQRIFQQFCKLKFLSFCSLISFAENSTTRKNLQTAFKLKNSYGLWPSLKCL